MIGIFIVLIIKENLNSLIGILCTEYVKLINNNKAFLQFSKISLHFQLFHVLIKICSRSLPDCSMDVTYMLHCRRLTIVTVM